MSLILITGSGRRIGAELAIKFAEKGWNIAIHYNESQASAESVRSRILELGGECEIFHCDLSKTETIKDSFSMISDTMGFPQVLINNAGVFPSPQKLIDMNDEDWDFVMNINLKSQFILSREYAKMAKANSRIINIASLGAFEIWKERIAYNVSKAGVIQLTKALARELAPNISVNSISPGTIILPEQETQNPIPLSKIPMNRYGTTEDIFEAAYFFATCSNFITGQNLSVDGGYALVRG